MTKAFADLRVLDFTSGMAGPLATMIFAENGAEVIKIESPSGDFARAESAFEMWNRGKKSVVLDLTKSPDLEAVKRLATHSDVVVEDLTPPQLGKLGLDYTHLSQLNNRLVYCSISAFPGTIAPLGSPAHDGVVSALLGTLNNLDDVQGASRVNMDMGTSAGRPLYKAAWINSFAASQLAAQAIIAALRFRRRTGVGQKIETSLLEGAATMLMRRDFSVDRVGSDVVNTLQQRGIRLAFLTVECADGNWIQMCARQDRHFRNWLAALDMQDELADSRYSNGPLLIPTVGDIEELESKIRERMRSNTQRYWIERFVQLDVGADPFFNPSEFLDHAQMKENGRVLQLTEADGTHTRQPGPLVLLGETRAPALRRAPVLGEHTENTLRSVTESRNRAVPLRKAGTQEDMLSGVSRKGPLNGIMILELAYYLAAPLAGSLLAQLGARVIKIEPPTGDPFRRVGSQAMPMLHGKESLAVDLKTPSGREILMKLADRADVLYTNFRPQAQIALWGGYDSIQRVNPNLVYLYAASYGSKGPWSARSAFHSTPNALCGAGLLQAGAGNAPVDDSWPDPVSGLGAATGILVGLAARDVIGRGGYAETTMLCSAAYAFSRDLMTYDATGAWMLLDAAQQGRSPLERVYPCRVGWLLIEILTNEEWMAFARGLGHPEWITDRRFSSSASRRANGTELQDMIGQCLAGQDAGYWEQLLSLGGVPAARADGSDPLSFLRSHGMVNKSTYGPVGEYWRLHAPYSFSECDSPVGLACEVGEHSRSILGWLGYGGHDVEALVREGVVCAPD